MQTHFLSSLILGALLAPLTPAQSRLIAIETAGTILFDVDPTTGARTSVGLIAGLPGFVGALAYDDTSGILYMASTAFDSLWTLDVTTLTATRIGDFNVGSSVLMHGLAVHPTTGAMFGKSTTPAGGGDFYSIDKATGQATPIGTTGLGGFGGLEWINNTLFFADTISDNLTTIDPTTGVATVIGPLGFAGHVGIGLAHDPAFGLLGLDNESDGLYSLDTATGAATLIGLFGTSNLTALEFIPTGGSVGSNYCTANPNSTGAPARMSASGSAAVAQNNLVLTAAGLPSNAFGFFATSLTQGFVSNPGGNQGNLCLGGSIGRYAGPGQVQNSGGTGTIALLVDLTQHPTPVGFIAVQAGETWNFTAWYRDVSGGSATSNLADGLEVTFN